MISFKAVIFDMDGVIVDNQYYHLDAWEVFCKKYNYPFDISSFRQKYFGKSNHEILNSLSSKNLTIDEALELGEEKEIIYRDIYRNDIKPIPGLISLLENLKQLGKPIAIASSAPISNIDFVVDSLNIRKYFDVIVDVSMVEFSKPNPDIYLKAAHLLNTNPLDCLVFEDSHSGIKAAQSAGMSVIALATTHKKEELNYNLTIVNDFTELSGLN
ncbi:MAG: HAD family hydrolase [Bacteroidales bacterium]